MEFAARTPGWVNYPHLNALKVLPGFEPRPKNLAPAEQKEWKCANPFNDVVKEIVQELARVSDCIKALHLDKRTPEDAAAPQGEQTPSLPAS